MSEEEEYKLKQEYLTPESERQQNLLNKANATDAAIKGIVEGDVMNIVHELVTRHPAYAVKMFDDFKYYRSKGAF